MGNEYKYIVTENFPVDIPRKLRDDFLLDNNQPDDAWVSASVKDNPNAIPPFYSNYDERVVIGYNTYEKRNNITPEYNISTDYSFNKSPTDLYCCWGYNINVVSNNERQGNVNFNNLRAYKNQLVQITAKPNPGYFFKRWSEQDKPISFVLSANENKNLTAFFTRQISVDKFESTEYSIGINKVQLRQGRYNITLIGGAGGNSGVCGSDCQVAAATGGGGLFLSGTFDNTTDDCYDVIVGYGGDSKTKGIYNWNQPIKAQNGGDSYISCGDIMIVAQGGSGACYGWVDTENKNSVGFGGKDFLSTGMIESVVLSGNNGNSLSGIQGEANYTINGSGYISNKYQYGSSKDIKLHFPSYKYYITKQDYHENGTQNTNGCVCLERLSHIKFYSVNDSEQSYLYKEYYLNRDSTIITPPEPSREGFSFLGWSQDGTTIISDLSTIAIKNSDGTSKDNDLSAIFEYAKLLITSNNEIFCTSDGAYICYEN